MRLATTMSARTSIATLASDLNTIGQAMPLMQFGLMAIAYEEPSRMANFHRKLEYPPLGIV